MSDSGWTLPIMSYREVEQMVDERNRAHRFHAGHFKLFGRRFWFGCELIKPREQ